MLAFSTHASVSSGSYSPSELATATRTGEAVYAASDIDFIQRFDRCLSKWLSDTHYISNATEMLRHEFYREIVRLGDRAVPLILQSLRHDPSWIVMASEDILGWRAYPATNSGRLSAICDAWLAWDDKRASTE